MTTARPNSENPRDGRIEYRRLRAPAEHGGVLVTPHDLQNAWQANKKTESQIQLPGGYPDPADVRKELIALATTHTRGYRDVMEPKTDVPVIMGGHQPTLFHPGVWFKNFLLSAAAKRLDATALNLVVDNDVCSNVSIKLPDPGNGILRTVAIDQPDHQIPFERRAIRDVEFFRSFGERVAREIGGLVSNPLVNRLWPHVQDIPPDLPLGHVLAAARHRLEADAGLETLELPVSLLARTGSFVRFGVGIFQQAARFSTIYNNVLREYRKVHRIRSRAHPAPDLEVRENRFELPFWIWSENGFRQRLFVSQTATGYRLAAGDEPVAEFEGTDITGQWQSLESRSIAIRPRALLLTMYCRLFACRMFLHGIGGSKYDQLTDAIIERFFNVRPPVYLTVTATMLLPSEFRSAPAENPQSIDTRLRELTFHPEVHLDESERQTADRWIRQKTDWIDREVPRGERIQRHRAIVDANEKMQPILQGAKDHLKEQRDRLEARWKSSRILGSREFSFCLHQENLMEELNAMATEAASGLQGPGTDAAIQDA